MATPDVEMDGVTDARVANLLAAAHCSRSQLEIVLTMTFADVPTRALVGRLVDLVNLLVAAEARHHGAEHADELAHLLRFLEVSRSAGG